MKEYHNNQNYVTGENRYKNFASTLKRTINPLDVLLCIFSITSVASYAYFMLSYLETDLHNSARYAALKRKAEYEVQYKKPSGMGNNRVWDVVKSGINLGEAEKIYADYAKWTSVRIIKLERTLLK